MLRRKIGNVAGVGIIYRAIDPGKIFTEVKDDGLPAVVFRRGLCTPGGNWIGEAARADTNPLATYRREIGEELSLERAAASTLESRLLGMEPDGNFYLVPRANVKPTPGQISALADIKRVIIEGATPFVDLLNTTPRAVLDRADANNKKGDIIAVVSYFATALREPEWHELAALQAAFGNLSNESITLVTSLDEIITNGMRWAYGHEHAMRRFFLAFGLEAAKDMLETEDVTSECLGTPRASYDDYLVEFDIERRP